MLKYVYPNRPTNDIQYSSPPNESPIIHNNVSTYAQALMQFHEFNPVPEISSHKRLKLQFNEKSHSNKRNTIKEIPQHIHNKSETKSVTLISSKSRGETNLFPLTTKKNQLHHSNNDSNNSENHHK